MIRDGWELTYGHDGLPYWFKLSTGEVESCNHPRYQPSSKMLDEDGVFVLTTELKTLIEQVNKDMDIE